MYVVPGWYGTVIVAGSAPRPCVQCVTPSAPSRQAPALYGPPAGPHPASSAVALTPPGPTTGGESVYVHGGSGPAVAIGVATAKPPKATANAVNTRYVGRIM